MQRTQNTQPGCSQITCNAAYTHAILPVGCNADIDDRIVQARPLGINLTDGRIVGEFDDTIMIIA